MKTLSKLRVLVSAMGFFVAVMSVQAISINETVNPGGTKDFYFENEFDLSHPKLMTFTGSVYYEGAPTASGQLSLFFDYKDPDSGEEVFQEFAPITLIGETDTPLANTWTIPFCPQEVSLHIRFTSDNAGYVRLSGDFTHECLTDVPDAGSTLVALAVSCLGLFGFRRLIAAAKP